MPNPADAHGLIFLYPLTLLLEVPGALARFLLFFPLIYAVLIPMGGDTEIATYTALALAFSTLVLSVLTLIFLPGGMFVTRWAMGARDPSQRELRILHSALEQILAQAPAGIRAPTHWFVIDSLDYQAQVVGTSLYLSGPLLNSPYLGAVIAHELGHINSFDGRLTLSLRRLTLPPAFWLARVLGWAAPRVTTSSLMLRSGSGCTVGCSLWAFQVLLLLAGGGLGPWLLSPLWVWHWREREFVADAFAARCGMAGELVEYLEYYHLSEPQAPFFLTEKPPTETRIDRLLSYPQYAR